MDPKPNNVSLKRPPPSHVLPSNAPKPAKRNARKYNKAWEDSFPWVTCTMKDGREVPYCKICQITLSTHRSCLSKHGNSAKHCELEAKFYGNCGDFDGNFGNSVEFDGSFGKFKDFVKNEVQRHEGSLEKVQNGSNGHAGFNNGDFSSLNLKRSFTVSCTEMNINVVNFINF